MTSTESLAVVIVTFNRRKDLEVTLTALQAMQAEFDYLVVVDNASTDGTAEFLNEFSREFAGELHVVSMAENKGGAGGFHAGVRFAMTLPVDWIWCSDDDAIAQPGALRNLLDKAISKEDAYGSVAVAKDKTGEVLCWPAPILTEGRRKERVPLARRSQLDEIESVEMLPFLGLMFSRQTVEKIGLPNKSYFISGDDVEYCIRIKQAGGRLWQVRDSLVIHPSIPRYIVNCLGRQIYCIEMPAWRRYYDCRNRIWNSLLGRGHFWAVLTTVSCLLRLGFALFYEQQREGQVAATFSGIWHGWRHFGDSRRLENISAS